jgi:DNA-binding response OmpR family regulator
MPTQGRVLVVDDDEGVREFLEAVLARAGFEVTGAATGEDALERAIEAPPDLVTLDVILPGIDGLETLRRLRQAQPSIRVIMLSGHAPSRASDEALRLGARDFLRKPLEPRALELAVERALAL